MTQQKAIQIHQFGDVDVLKFENITLPALEEGQMLIRNHAAGVNPVDYKSRAGGGVAGMLGDNPFPWVPGYDVAGIVEQAGDGAGFAIGDRVYGMIGFPVKGGGYATHIVAESSNLAIIPDTIDFTTAAAVPLAALTAWQALFDAGDLQAGQRILIHAAAGGVGHFTVQFAKWRGATVIGTASAHNQAYLHEIGVDEFVDYTKQDFEDSVETVDFILNCVDQDTLNRSFKVIKPGGTIISIAGTPDEKMAEAHNVHAKQILVYGSGEHMTKISDLIAAGHVNTHIQKILPLEDVAEAHRLISEGHVRGKLVLKI